MGWSFQNRTFMEVAKEHATNQIQAIPVNSDYMLQVYSFSNVSRPVFPNGPKLVTPASKQEALDFVAGLYASGGTDPFDGLNEGIQKEHVEQMIILSDGVAYDQGTCFHNGRFMKYADCYREYNEKIKSRHPSIPHYKTEPVSIDTVSLKWDFCAGSNIPWTHIWAYINNRWTIQPINREWLGELSKLNDGQCRHVQ